MPVYCQRVLRADVPAVNRIKGTSSSKKVTQDHEIVRNVGKRADDQYEVSDFFFSCFVLWPSEKMREKLV